MKLGTIEFAIYTAQNFLHLIYRTVAVESSVDKVGVIASEPVAYAFIKTISLDISTTQSKQNNDYK
jgi:hypothetical protein